MNGTGGSKNVLASDVEIKGNLKFSGELTFEGKIDGEIQTDGTLNLGDSAEVGIVEGQEFRHAVLDHQRHQANVVGTLALNRVLGDQPFPGGIDLRGLGQKFKQGAGGGDLRAGLGGGHAKPAVGQTKRDAIRYLAAATFGRRNGDGVRCHVFYSSL